MTCSFPPRRFRAIAKVAVALVAPMACAVAPASAAPDGEGGAGSVSVLALVVARQGGAPIPTTSPMRDRAAGFARPAPLMPRDAPDVFGSVALPVMRTALDARWRHATHGMGGALGGAADALVASLRDAPRAQQVAAVNAWVNARTTFTPDGAGPDGDDWAPAAQTLRTRRGDCEDYAIAKLALMRELGVAPGDLYLVVAYDLVRRQDHAMLVVRTDTALLLLDSATDRVQDATTPSDYRPLLSFSAARAWVHGYATERAAPRYAAIAPAKRNAS